MQIGVWQRAIAQSLIVPTTEPRSAPPPEQVVNNLVQKNLTRAQGLAAYQGTRTYRLEYQGFPGSRSAEMVADVRYESPGTKEFTIRSETGSKLLIDGVFKKLLQSEELNIPSFIVPTLSIQTLWLRAARTHCCGAKTSKPRSAPDWSELTSLERVSGALCSYESKRERSAVCSLPHLWS